MSLPLLFLSGVAAWLLAWSVLLALAWRNRRPHRGLAMSLFDDTGPPRAPQRSR